MKTARRPSVSSALLLAVLSISGCQATPQASESSRVATVEAFRAAREAGDTAALQALLSDDPRVWYDEHEGAGSPWNPGAGGGRWEAWDEHFRGVTERTTEWHDEGDRVWADMFEINDYFLLTERGGGTWRGTYFFDDAGRLSGFMVSSAAPTSPEDPKPKDRRREFEAWAVATHPEEAEYLMPGGSLDPTGDRAPRMRVLLNEWRAAVGLEPILGP